MDEIDKLQTQIGALIRARDHLLEQVPSDMVAVAEITERIVDLSRRVSALAESDATIPQLTPAQEKALERAVKALDDAVKRSAAASEILTAAAKVASAGAPKRG